MSTIIKMNVEKAVRDSKIDLISFTADCPEYHAFYVNPLGKARRITEINLSSVKNSKLLRHIVEFMDYSINPRRRSGIVYHHEIVCGMAFILKALPYSAKSNIQEFLKATQTDKISNWNYEPKVCAHMFRKFYYRLINLSNDPFAGDIIELDRLKIAPERQNDTTHRRTIGLFKIKNPKNKELVRQYVKYLFHNTNNSISTIASKVASISAILNLCNKSYIEWTQDDADLVIQKLLGKNYKKKTLVTRLIYAYTFTDYLLTHELIQTNPLKKYHQLARTGPYQYRATAEDKYVITQIFNVLDKIDLRTAICFLLIYCTGMRVSEACGIDKNCLERSKDTPNQCFVRFYQSKMRKDVTNVIPKALYDLIDNYRQQLPTETRYLFPGRYAEIPWQSQGFSERLRRELIAQGVKERDGTPYHFTAHSFRHLMAVKMRDEDIPIQYIQEQLHHSSPEMTMAYCEYLDRQKITEMKKFVDHKGNLAPIGDNISHIANDDEYAEYMRKFINTQILPDGICNRPVKLGKCPHCNACLSCPDWRTSADFLDVHQKQLKRVRDFISIARKNGWIMQLHEAEENEKRLSKIVDTLGRMVKNDSQ